MNEQGYRLRSCPKHYTVDQDKTIEPSETVRIALEKLKKRFDLSNLRIERRSDAIEGAYSFSSLSDQLSASGKGLTPEQSQASAIMEFAERYSWLHFDCENYDGYTIKSYNEMIKGPTPTVKPDYFLGNFIDLTEREKREITEEIMNIPLKWVRSLCLDDYSQFYYPINWHNYIYTSNGLATGNAMEETIIQALCELIERENIARLLRDKKVANEVDQDSITNPFIRKVLDNSKRAGISFIIKDLSFDFKIPTFLVYGTDSSRRRMLTYKGAGQGTHLNPEKALIRSLAEYFEAYSLMKNLEEQFDIDWEQAVPLMPKKHFGFLINLNNEMVEKKRNKVVKLKDINDLSRHDIKDEIELVLKIFSRFGYRVHFVDKTHPELNIPVCRMFVPQFRNVIVNEIHDPWFILSEVYFEAGDNANSEKCLKRSLLRASFDMPENCRNVKPKQIFRENYKETLLAVGGFKKDLIEILKQFSPVLKRVKR